jgi:hypothetical protein
MLRYALIALLVVGAAGCGDDGIDPPRAIDVLPTASAISVVAGSSGTVNVVVQRAGGYTGDVTLTVEATPTGVTAVFAPATLPNGTASSALTLTVASSAAAGTAPITIRAAGTGIADKTATIQLTVLGPTPTTGAITWKFCSPTNRTIWLAVQDGTAGAWKQVIGTSNTYHFDVTQPSGAVAWVREPVPDNYVTTVFQGTADEIAAFGANDCLGRTATSKSLTGTVTGFTPSTGISGDLVRIGTTGASDLVVGGPSFQLFDVPDGPRDFVATRVSHTFANETLNDTLTKLIVRRGVNATSTLEAFDFNGPEAVGPTVADLALSGTNGETTLLSMSFITDATAPPRLAAPLYTATLGTASSAPLYTVPFPLQREGDLHQLTLVTGPVVSAGDANVSGRRLTKFFSGPQNQTLTMGPVLAIPTTTQVAASPPRFRAQAPVQPGYDRFYIAEWFQFPNLSPTRGVSLIITSAYAGGTAWDATIPDLTPAGWDPAWGLRAGIETGTFFSGEGSTFATGVPSGARDGGTVTSASRTTLPTGFSGSEAGPRGPWFRPMARSRARIGDAGRSRRRD